MWELYKLRHARRFRELNFWWKGVFLAVSVKLVWQLRVSGLTLYFQNSVRKGARLSRNYIYTSYQLKRENEFFAQANSLDALST